MELLERCNRVEAVLSHAESSAAAALAVASHNAAAEPDHDLSPTKLISKVDTLIANAGESAALSARFFG